MKQSAWFQALSVICLLLIPNGRYLLAQGDSEALTRINTAVESWKNDGQLASLLPVLIESRNAKDVRVRTAANETLATIGPDVSAVMTWVLEQAQRPNHWNPNIEKQVSDALGKFGLEAVPAMLQAAAVDHGAQRLQRSSYSGSSFGVGQRLQKVFATALSKQDDAALPTLLALLGDQTHSVRAVAADTLRIWGARAKPAMPQLLAALDDRDGEVRVQALGAVMILAVSEPPGLEALCAAIREHRDPKLRHAALTRLSMPEHQRLQTENLLAAVRDALSDPHGNTRHAAARILLKRPEHRDLAEQVIRRDCGSREFSIRQQALQTLLPTKDVNPAFARTVAARALTDESFMVRNTALEVLRSSGLDSDTKPRVLEALSDEEPQVRSMAASVLWEAGESVVAMKVWLSQLKTPNSPEYSAAQSRLYQVTKVPDDVEPLLAEALGSNQVEIRRIAIYLLTRRATLSETSLAAIQRLAKDTDSSVRSQALQLLRNRNVSKEARLKLLTDGLADPDASVRQQTVSQLFELGTAAKPAIPKLLLLLKDPKEQAYIRQTILNALPQLGAQRETVIPEMVALLKDNDRLIVPQAIRVLGSFGPEAVPHIVPLLNHKDSAVRTAASSALLQLVSQNPGLAPKLAPELLAQYATARESDRNMLRSLLRQLGAGGVKVLSSELSSPQVETRRVAADTLRHIGSGGAQSAEKELLAALQDDDLIVRLNVALALVAIGSRASVDSSPRVVSVLLEGAKSDDAEVRLLAARVSPADRVVNGELVAAMKNILRDKDVEAVAGAARYLLAHREVEAVKPVLPKLIDTLGTETPASQVVFSMMSSLRPLAKDVAPLLAIRLKNVSLPQMYLLSNAFRALGPNAFPALKTAWAGSDRQRQTVILNALGGGTPEAVPVLIDLFETADPNILQALSATLGAQATRSPEAQRFLIARLDNPDLRIASTAAAGLSSAQTLPESVVAPLLRLLRAALAVENAEQRAETSYILRALGRTGSNGRSALGALTELMNDMRAERATLRCTAAAAIIEIEPNHTGVATVLADCVAGQTDGVAIQAAQALVRLGPRARMVLPKLEAALPNASEYVRNQLTIVLAQCESESPLLLEVLGDQLENSQGSAYQAVQTVKLLGPKAKPLVPKLLLLLDQPNAPKQDVVAALGRATRDSPEVVERLGKLLETDRNVRQMTLLALADQGERAKPAATAIEAVWSSDQQHRTLAAAVLVLMKADVKSRASTTLLAMLEPDWGGIPQLAMADALAVLGSESDDARKNLQAALEHTNINIRVCAARALWKIEHKPDSVLPILLDGVKHAGLNGYMHIESARTLTDIGPPGKAAAPDLIRLVNVANGEQQLLYVKALKSINPAAAADAGF